MNEEKDSTVGRAVIIGALMIATLGFSMAGLCGAFFTVMGLSGLSASGPENFSSGILVIAVPSLVIGGALAAWCASRLTKHFRKDK